MKLSARPSNSRSVSPRASAATASASSTPATGSEGMVDALCRVIEPSSSSTTRSVKVPPVSVAKRISEGHRVGALEAEHDAGLGRRRDFDLQYVQDRPQLQHLLGIARRQFALADIEAVLEPDPDAAADQRAL